MQSGQLEEKEKEKDTESESVECLDWGNVVFEDDDVVIENEGMYVVHSESEDSVIINEESDEDFQAKKEAIKNMLLGSGFYTSKYISPHALDESDFYVRNFRNATSVTDSGTDSESNESTESVCWSDGGLDFKQTRAKLRHKLERRPARKELVGQNILKGGDEVAHSLHATQVAIDRLINFRRTAKQIEKKMVIRPTQDELVHHNILTATSSVAPSLQAAQFQLKSQITAASLDHKLENRPHAGELVESYIIRGAVGIAPSLARRQQDIKYQKTATAVDHKLVSRPAKKDLVVSNIIKTGGDQVSSVIQERQQAIKFKKARSSMGKKISSRPGKEQLVDQNILKTRPTQIELATQAIRKHRIRETLEERLEKRPQRGDTRMRALLKENEIDLAAEISELNCAIPFDDDDGRQRTSSNSSNSSGLYEIEIGNENENENEHEHEHETESESGDNVSDLLSEEESQLKKNIIATTPTEQQ